ncbi:MAG TPA: DinB family protein [Acidobacteriaceae bacterium]
MELNPYAKYLGDRDPLETMRETASAIRRLLARMPAEQLQQQPPAKRWNAREIVCHLADCELVFSFRLKQTLAEDSPVLQPFDQEKWALRYENLDAESALRMFEASRNWNLLLLDATTAEERRRPVTHPERGTMTLWTIAETIGGHDINHLGQLERLAG